MYGVNCTVSSNKKEVEKMQNGWFTKLQTFKRNKNTYLLHWNQASVSKNSFKMSLLLCQLLCARFSMYVYMWQTACISVHMCFLGSMNSHALCFPINVALLKWYVDLWRHSQVSFTHLNALNRSEIHTVPFKRVFIEMTKDPRIWLWKHFENQWSVWFTAVCREKLSRGQCLHHIM